ncbi:hypothetical protein HZH68_014959 [Vespula germanica]|uniref:Uncharacterized protein n=1 Tax=Vespula germanica TaxID=30212 RepID=A0A834J820_VESGE|nr:hypothetical protein HZH68_014959 [Vespula germanica]
MDFQEQRRIFVINKTDNRCLCDPDNSCKQSKPEEEEEEEEVEEEEEEEQEEEEVVEEIKKVEEEAEERRDEYLARFTLKTCHEIRCFMESNDLEFEFVQIVSTKITNVLVEVVESVPEIHATGAADGALVQFRTVLEARQRTKGRKVDIDPGRNVRE